MVRAGDLGFWGERKVGLVAGESARLIRRTGSKMEGDLLGWAEAKGEGKNFGEAAENFGFETEAGAARFS